MKIPKHLSLAVIAGILLFSTECSKKESIPDDIIPPKDMVEILTDMHTIDAYFMITTNYRMDTLENEMFYSYRELFEKHKISEEDFTRSMDYYSAHEKEFHEIYEKAVLNLNRK